MVGNLSGNIHARQIVKLNNKYRIDFMDSKLRQSYLEFLSRYDLEAMIDVSPSELLYHIRANSDSDEDTIEAELLLEIMREGQNK